MTTPSIDTTRRRMLQLMGVGAAATLLPACSGGSGGSGGGGATSVVWQAIPSYSLQGTDANRVAYLTEQRKKFESSSGFTLDPQVTVADTTAAMAKLVQQASQGRAPDISQVDGYIFGLVADQAQPLTTQLEAAGLALDDWFPSLQPNMTGGGDTVRALQFTTDVRVLYYRKDVVPTPPASWDELVAMAKPLAADGQVMTFPAGRSEGAVTTTLWPQYWSQGQELFDDAGEPAFTSGPGYDAMLASLEVVAKLIREGVAPARVATFGSEDDQNADVAAGRVPMFIGGNWQSAVLNNLVPKKDFFDTWGVAPIPTISGDGHKTSAGGWVWAGFTKDQKVLDAGIDWVNQTFVSDEGMANWCTLGGYLPPRESVYDNAAYTQNAFTPTYRQHLADYAKVRPSVAKYSAVSQAMQIALSSVASGTEPKKALDNALGSIS